MLFPAGSCGVHSYLLRGLRHDPEPAGIKGTIISLALIIVIVGVAYFVASGHDIQIPDLANGGFFSQGETVLTDTSILVTYVALVAAFVTAIATEIYGAFK